MCLALSNIFYNVRLLNQFYLSHEFFWDIDLSFIDLNK
jgi:hypothetical protein